MLRHYPLNPATGLEDAAQLPWTNGNPTSGQEGSYPPFGLFTDPQESILSAQAAAGITAANDPTQLAQALARGIHLGTFSGGVNALTATLPGGIVFPSILSGLKFSGVPAFTNTGSVTIQITGLTSAPAAIQLLRRDGSALQAGDIALAVLMTFAVDASGNFRLANLGQAEVPRIVPAQTLYVRTDGSDTNDGSANTAAKAFATTAAAIAAAAKLYQTGSGTTIQLGLPGTYAFPTLPPSLGKLTIRGDVANQSAYILSGNGGIGSGTPCLDAAGSSLFLFGLTLSNTGTTNDTLAAGARSTVNIENVSLTSVNGGAAAHLQANNGGSIAIGPGCRISGSRQAALSTFINGSITVQANAVLNVDGNPTFAGAFAVATQNASVNVASGGSISGSATGVRYSVSFNSTMNVSGGGQNIFPGNSAGVYPSGGQYA